MARIFEQYTAVVKLNNFGSLHFAPKPHRCGATATFTFMFLPLILSTSETFWTHIFFLEMFWFQNGCFFQAFSPCSMSVISPYHLFLIEHHHQSPLSPSQYSPHIQFRLCYRKLLKSHFSIYLSSCVPLLLQTTNLKSWINCIWNHISSVNMDLTHTAHEQLV